MAQIFRFVGYMCLATLFVVVLTVIERDAEREKERERERRARMDALVQVGGGHLRTFEGHVWAPGARMIV